MLAVLPCTAAYAEDVPLPRPRPAATAVQQIEPIVYPTVAAGPSACEVRLSDLATFASLPMLIGPGECGGGDMVRLESVRMPDGPAVTLAPAPVLRCRMAEALAIWVRQEVAPAAATLGAPLKQIANFDSYECRGRNRVPGAKLSEHGKGNAIDIRAVVLRNGTTLDWTDPKASKEFRDRMRVAACGRFTTVLGPGSDSYHENHIHLDLAERARGYRMCQWDVREPKPAVEIASKSASEAQPEPEAKPETGEATPADVPLPPARPASLAARK